MAEELKYKVSIESDRIEASDLIAPAAIDSLVELNREIEDYRDALRSLKEAEKEQGGLTEEQAVLQERLKGRIKETSGEYQRQQRELVKMSTASNAVGNSYNDLVKQNAALSAAMRALPIDDTTGEMERLRAEYVKNNDELKKFDSAMGNNQRNVGNYQSALDGLGGALKSIPGPIGDIAKMFEMLTKTFGAVTTAVAGKTTVVQGFTAAETTASVATAGHTAATVAQTAAVGASTAAIGFETAATNTNTAATIGNASAQGVNAAALGGKAAASATATAATGSLTLAQRALNTVMKANPILLVIGLIAGLASAFSGLQPVMDKIKEVTVALGSAFEYVRDTVYRFITGQEALQASFTESVRRSVELERKLQELRDLQDDQIIKSAESRQLIAKLRLEARDEEVAIADRIKKLNESSALEFVDTAARIELMKKEVEALKEKDNQYFSTAANRRAIAQKEAELIDLGTQSYERQKAMDRELTMLKRKQVAEEKAILDEQTSNAKESAQKALREQERIAKEQQAIADAAFKSWSAQQQEILSLRDEIEQGKIAIMDASLATLDLDTSSRDQAILANAEQFGQELAALEIANAIRTGDQLKVLDLQQAEDIRQRKLFYMSLNFTDAEAAQMALTDMTISHAQERADAELAIERAKADQQVQLIVNLGNTITGIGTAMFGKNKAIAVAQAIIDTYAAANSAAKNTPGGFLIKAAATAAMIAKGLANVRMIMSTNIGSSGGGGGATGGNMAGMSVTPVGTLMPTNFRLQAPMAGEVGASMSPAQGEAAPIYVDASVDERGMAIAVRRGESQIRSQQVVFT
jgi:hypothetical protein